MKMIPLTLAMILAGCTLTSTLPRVDVTGDSLTIFGDAGGNPYEYAILWDQLNATGKTVRLGECNSACTMFLSLPRVCMLAGRRFGFHRSSGPVLERFVADYLPGALRQRYLQVWSKSKTLTKLTAEEVQAIEPSVKICSPDLGVVVTP